MNENDDLLKNYASSNSKFFTLQDDEEAQVKYLSAEIVPNKFDNGKTNCVSYHLEQDGIEKIWDRTSRDLAQQMSKITKGATIIIKRSGQGNKTKYNITVVEQ